MDTIVRERIESFLDQKGVRRTQQRMHIIEAAFNTTRHYTADELLDMSRAIDPSVSRATVYRTLPLLVESGLLKELDLGKAHKFYDPNYAMHPHHNHLICVDCDRIVEFEDELIESREDEISKKLGFRPENKSVQIRASCEELKNSGSCSSRETCARVS